MTTNILLRASSQQAETGENRKYGKTETNGNSQKQAKIENIIWKEFRHSRKLEKYLKRERRIQNNEKLD